MINILEYLENTAPRFADKTAFADETSALTFGALYRGARAIGSALLKRGLSREPVVVFMQKSPQTICAFLGAVTAGCYYVPLDEEMPGARLRLILEQLRPRAAICDRASLEAAAKHGLGDIALLYDDIVCAEADEEALRAVRDRAIDTDPIYVVFTSGSTGIPKGVAACHRSVIDYVDSLAGVLRVDADTVFGLQVPLYVDACLKEVFCTLKAGATTWMIPKKLFMFPIQLVEYLNRHEVNTLCWVVSALTIVSGLGAFKKVVPSHLRTIAFGSEVFPIRQFNLWKQHVPNARYINLYGPTETTGMTCWYEVDREFSEGDAIPIGRPFRNREILLLNGDSPAAPGEPGEICIRGTCLTLGYYNAFDKTAEAFTQNPLNPHYPELIYRTGDIARYNERGELVFVSRRDSQIKHMGQRIELGEVEIAAVSVEGVGAAGCIFDGEKKRIVLYYAGEPDEAAVATALKDKLPRYMIPNLIYRLERMPYTNNGKLDRVALKARYESK
jgi:amino acid adenylation domain-containing protein